MSDPEEFARVYDEGEKAIADLKTIRTFETGATRDTDEGKPDYEGFLSPLVIERYGEYMTKHRRQANGQLRDSDNWQKGIPLTQYMKSMMRHFIEVWSIHRSYRPKAALEEALCALIFNAMGYLHEHLKAKMTKTPVDNTSKTATEILSEEPDANAGFDKSN